VNDDPKGGGGRGRSDPPASGPTPKAVSRVGRAAAAGTEMVVLFVAGFLLGRYLSGTWHTGPWPVVAGIFLGFGGGLWAAYRMLATS
jgi:F0F1-type ATP synthase assembly protein I